MESLQLLQLADSAVPVGSLSHSFGLETLVFDGDLPSGVRDCPAALRWYVEDSLAETLLAEAVFCREAHSRALQGLSLTDLNERCSAFRLTRESRDASLAMGRRFAALIARVQPSPAMSALTELEELHYSIAFGFVCGLLGIEVDGGVRAFLHQAVLSAISAAQRLAPLGQIEASRIAWDLKAAIGRTAERSRVIAVGEIQCFSHLAELASMRHACLPTRLFIS